MSGEKLYKLSRSGISFYDPETKFDLRSGEKKPLPKRFSQLLKEWVRAKGIIPVPEPDRESEKKELEASIGLKKSGGIKRRVRAG